MSTQQAADAPNGHDRHDRHNHPNATPNAPQASREAISDTTRQALIRVQRQLMSDWSEQNWAAGWMVGLEEELCHGSNQEMREHDPEIADIHAIAALTGVWCELDHDVPLDQWEAAHGPALTRMADAEPTPDQIAALERVYARQIAWWKEIGLMKDGEE